MFRFDKRLLGVEIGTAGVRVAHVKFGKQGPELLGAAQSALPDGALNEGGVALPGEVSQAIREAAFGAGGGRTTRRVVAGIPGRYLAARQLTVPTMDHSELKEAVKWETAQYLPYPVEEAAVDFFELGPNGSGGLDVVSISTRKVVVDGIVKTVEQAGLEPIALDAVPLAVARALIPRTPAPAAAAALREAAATADTPNEEALAIVDVGAAGTDVSIFRNRQLRVCRNIPVGGIQFTTAIAAALQVSEAEAEKLKLTGATLQGSFPSPAQPETIAQAMRAVAEELAKEIQRSLDYFRAQTQWLPVHRLILTGSGARISGLDRYLSEILGLRVSHEQFNKAIVAKAADSVEANVVSPASLGLALWEVSYP